MIVASRFPAGLLPASGYHTLEPHWGASSVVRGPIHPEPLEPLPPKLLEPGHTTSPEQPGRPLNNS
jgi:hypothetical protein